MDYFTNSKSWLIFRKKWSGTIAQREKKIELLIVHVYVLRLGHRSEELNGQFHTNFRDETILNTCKHPD
jgi:hypothetical protein